MLFLRLIIDALDILAFDSDEEIEYACTNDGVIVVDAIRQSRSSFFALVLSRLDFEFEFDVLRENSNFKRL